MVQQHLQDLSVICEFPHLQCRTNRPIAQIRLQHSQSLGILYKLFATFLTAIALLPPSIPVFGQLLGLTMTTFHYFHYMVQPTSPLIRL